MQSAACAAHAGSTPSMMCRVAHTILPVADRRSQRSERAVAPSLARVSLDSLWVTPPANGSSNSSRAIIMSIDQIDTIDFATIDKSSGDLWLTISNHLPWEENESNHLTILQEKIHSYLRFIESGEILTKVPDAKGRIIVINIVGKFALSQRADVFLCKARAVVERAGFRLSFSLMRFN